MNTFIIVVVVSLLYARLTAGVAIPPSSSPATMGAIILPNNNNHNNHTSLTDDHDTTTTHCSSDHASYGQLHPSTVACVLAMYDLFQSPKITTLQYMYPMDFVSSTAPLPAEGNGFRTPWRSTYGELPSQPTITYTRRSSHSDDRMEYNMIECRGN